MSPGKIDFRVSALKRQTN